jgi:hypothetical protein
MQSAACSNQLERDFQFRLPVEPTVNSSCYYLLDCSANAFGLAFGLLELSNRPGALRPTESYCAILEENCLFFGRFSFSLCSVIITYTPLYVI